MKILFVCTGNICRSPTAEGVFRDLAARAGLAAHIQADSAATHGYHVGEPPDARSCAAAAARGFDLTALRARRVEVKDFEVFDLILAMDAEHLARLEALRPNGARADVKLFLDFHPKHKGGDVPDPYYGGDEGFTRVLDMIEQTSVALVEHVRTRVK
ncbi:MAG: low molecular weight protein-tyrosine-phosphatase [Candidatus Binataceae bacterium]